MSVLNSSDLKALEMLQGVMDLLFQFKGVDSLNIVNSIKLLGDNEQLSNRFSDVLELIFKDMLHEKGLDALMIGTLVGMALQREVSNTEVSG